MTNPPSNQEGSAGAGGEPDPTPLDAGRPKEDAAPTPARGASAEASVRAPSDPRDELFMRAALEEAEEAAAAGDVPVGAIIVGPSGAVLARGRNRREQDRDPTAHAEVDALRIASRAISAWRLEGATVYVTLEPCPMCAGALVNARVARVVYGCSDPKAGAIDTLFNIGRDARLNHRFEVTSGVLATECAAILRAFFAARRVKPAAGGADR